MSFEFFTTQQNYVNQNGTSSQIGAKHTAALKKDTLEPFKATKSATKNDHTSEDKKQFSDFLDSLKQAKSKGATAQVAAQDKTGANISAFQTNQSATEVSEFAAKTSDLPTASLSLLSEKLQTLIDQQARKGNEPTAGLIQTLDGETAEGDADAKALRGLLSALITKILGKAPAAEGTDDTAAADVTAQPATTDEDNLLTLLGGLSPQQITDLKAQIDTFLTGQLSSEDEAALAALINQFYPLARTDSAPEKKSEAGTTASTIADNVLKTDLRANENTAQKGQEQPQNKAQTRYDARYDATQTPQSHDDGGKSFDAAMKAADGKDAASPAPKNADGQQTAGQRFLQTVATTATSSSLDGTLSQNALSATTSSPTTMQNALTNITTQAQSAGQNHPATQMVSVTIQKAIKTGDDTNIKLRLDPPDLGRVEVKMSIDKDSKTKIVLTAEKPETFLMLQRDSQALHRALVNAGIDGGDISFEMASDSHDFNQEQSGGNGGRGGSGKDAAGDEHIIQSTMDWHVDPDTGRMRYNALI
tara:strand:+ start:38503 stop:40101 length:1599 start_codon:yes stop_codon:yes gene_type:complete